MPPSRRTLVLQLLSTKLHARSARRAFLSPLASGVILLGGCTLLPMKNLQPVIAPPEATPCKSEEGLLKVELPLRGGPAKLHYVVPDGSRIAIVDSFADYRARVQSQVASRLPPELANHPVTRAFIDLLGEASAEAQLDAQIAGDTKFDPKNIESELADIRKHRAVAKLKQGELKDFAHKFFELQLRQGPVDFTGGEVNKKVVAFHSEARALVRPKLDPAFVAYFKTYYDGTFFDRLSNPVDKPDFTSGLKTLPVSYTIPDAEIVAAEKVLLEFLVDCIDPTPVLGNTDTPGPGTKYYPGDSDDEPTALVTGFASGGYLKLNDDGCGINLENVWVLKDIAGAASDQAAAVGGLIANTPGGVSIGLGIVGKISIGDNQTLSDVVKTAASELALRAALSASYFSLRRIQFDPIHLPGHVPPG